MSKLSVLYQNVKSEILQRLDFKDFYFNEIGDSKLLSSDKKNVSVKCVFHSDKNPSLSINLETGDFHCFGCNEKGSVFDFYMKIHRDCKFITALEALANKAGVSMPTKKSSKKETKKSSPTTFQEKFDAAASREIPEEGRRYLRNRGFTNKTIDDLISKKLIGWNSKAWYGYNDFRSALVFPMFNFQQTEIVGIQNIFVYDGNKKFMSKSKSSQGWFFYDQNLKHDTEKNQKSNTFIFAEAIIDIISAVQANSLSPHKIDNLTGVSVLSTSTVNKLKIANFDEEDDIVLFFDNPNIDQAGKKAFRDAIEILPDARVVDWSDSNFKDINDFIKNGDFGESIVKMIEEAETKKSRPESEKDREIFELLEAVRHINEEYAVVGVGGDTVVIQETEDPVDKKVVINFMSFRSFQNRFMNVLKINPFRNRDNPKIKKYKNLGTMWLEHTQRREYKTIVFDPSQELANPKEYYNLFRGFPVKPKKGEKYFSYMDHILNIICEENEHIYHWLCCWMARIVQDPGCIKFSRPGTSIVLRSDEGTGKGVFVNNFGKLFGPHFIPATQQKHLLGNFNKMLGTALLVYGDEIVWGGDQQKAGVLKALITEDYFTMEAKGRDALPIKAYSNLILSTNAKWAAPAGMKSRRFLVLEVKDDKIGNTKYFKKIIDDLKDGGLENLMYFLLNYKIDVDLNVVPKTDALLNQIVLSMSSEEIFWYEQLHRGYIVNQEWEIELDKELVYDQYLEFCNIHNKKYPEVLSTFSKSLKKMCPNMKGTRKVVNSTGKRVQYYKFPELEVCRKDFEKLVNMTVEWDDDEYED